MFAKENLLKTIESTSQWKKYSGLKANQREKNLNLISEALVQAYVDLDDLLQKSEVEVLCSFFCEVFHINFVSMNLDVHLYVLSSLLLILSVPMLEILVV